MNTYTDLVRTLRNVHSSCSPTQNWRALNDAQPPEEPKRTEVRQTQASKRLDAYQPSFWDRLFGKSETKKAALAGAVEEATLRDQESYEAEVRLYDAEFQAWTKKKDLASRVLAKRPDAIEAALNNDQIQGIFENYGAKIELEVLSQTAAEARVLTHLDQVIPVEEFSLLKSGKLSIKKMTKSNHYQLCRVFVCGCALRAASEIFATVPLETALVHVVNGADSSKTGHYEEQTVLSVAIPRMALDKLKLASVNPADAIENFAHNIDFKKTKGLQPVKQITTMNG